MPSRLPIVAMIVGAVLATSCVRRSEIRGVQVAGLDRTLSTFAFIEEGKIASLIVDARATRLREGDKFIPLEISVANRGLRTLTITRESFTLIDEAGNRYSLAAPRDLLEGYEFLDLDRDLAELEGIVSSRFANFTLYPSQFAPTRLADRGIVKDRVTLPRFGYLLDFVYFPAPRDGVLNKRFELHLAAPELPSPIFVKFIVL